MKNPTPKKAPVKKTSFSDRQYVDEVPSEDDIATKEEARYLPIDVVERDLDRWAWGTQNFTWEFYRDKRNETWVSASLELLIPWKDDAGVVCVRILVGACNFLVTAYAPNSHFIATAKSECVKNAASDLGKKFGRGLNHSFAAPINHAAPEEVPMGKMKPDKGILAQFKKACEEGDETHKGILLSIYEFIPEEINHEH